MVEYKIIYGQNGQIEYKGDMLHNFYHSQGYQFLMDGYYKGEFKYGKWHGKGERVTYPFCEKYEERVILKYVGNFACGKSCGYGELFENGRLKYKGEWMDGRFVNGVEYNDNYTFEGLMYSGNAVPVGVDSVPVGIYNYSNGERRQVISVRFDENGNTITKEIRYYTDNMKEYEGEIMNNKKHGEGILWARYNSINNSLMEDDNHIACSSSNDITAISDNVNYRYEGDFVNDRFEGNGTIYHANGKKWLSGQFKNGMANGKCKLFDNDGFKRYDGDFKEGTMHGEGMLYERSGRLKLVRFFKGKLRD